MIFGAVTRRGGWCALGFALLAAGCKKSSAGSPASPAPADSAASSAAAPRATFPLADSRAKLKTQIFASSSRDPAPEPPAGVFEKVSYAAPLGKNVAYVSPPKAGGKRPAIVWIAGGMDWGIAADSWEAADPSNDQSARAFREGGGIVLMRPSLRGSNENPGKNECFLGEVDDVLAAADYLAARPDVDATRIYLGGHSTGGTMALLAAASTSRFRAVFAFGPVADPRQYGDSGCLPMKASDAEAVPRSPIRFLKDIRSPTFVIEGEQGNARALKLLMEERGTAPLTFYVIPGADHFSTLAPTSEALARQISTDTGPTPRFELDVAALGKQAVQNAARAPQQ